MTMKQAGDICTETFSLGQEGEEEEQVTELQAIQPRNPPQSFHIYIYIYIGIIMSHTHPTMARHPELLLPLVYCVKRPKQHPPSARHPLLFPV